MPIQHLVNKIRPTLQIRWLLTHVTEDTFGTYQCKATDKSGNVTSRELDMVVRMKVKVKLLEWTEDYVSLLFLLNDFS